MMLIAKCEQMRHQLYLKRVLGRVDTIGNLNGIFQTFYTFHCIRRGDMHPNIGAQGPGGTTCSGSVKQFQNPESQTCIQGMRSRNTYKFPDDFCGLTTFYEEYECPSSKVRIIRSNNIPNHDVTIGNPNVPCDISHHITLPLYFPNIQLHRQSLHH